MKSNNDNTQNNTPEKHTITPQSAMDDYFNDMFGSSDDPLQELSVKQNSSGNKASNLATQNRKKETKTAPKPKLKSKNYKNNFNSLPFEEPEVKTTNISSLIIPAAFPKLAPAQTCSIPEAKVTTSLETQVESSIQVEEPKTKITSKISANVKSKLNQKVKPKVNAKIALAILEKQKTKLSVSQQQRLEEKLKQLSKSKAKIVSQIDAIENIPSSTHNSVSTLKKTLDIAEVKTAEQKIIVSPDLVVQKNNKPDWAKSRFECLIFTVAGLKLAVPLISLGAIYKIEKDFTPLVGRVSWFMGLYQHLDRNVRVIDTAQLVMPERCSPEVRAAYKFIIRLGGNDWGIACDAVHQSIQLSPDQIKWRTERSKRAWLLGTVIDHMCALIDTDSLSAMLNQHGTKKPSIFS